jgi:hypothetical protein
MIVSPDALFQPPDEGGKEWDSFDHAGISLNYVGSNRAAGCFYDDHHLISS